VLDSPSTDRRGKKPTATVDDVLVSDHFVVLAGQLAQVLGLASVVGLVPV
jgi:hypothetical protein